MIKMTIESADSIIVKEGVENGPTVTVFGGVHGNERVGVLAIQKAIKELEIVKGKVIFVFANPSAIEKDVRQIDKNLNRLFLEDNHGDAYEDQRARELMEILNSSVALLDIHAVNNPKAPSFVITESNAFDIVKEMDFEIVTSNWYIHEPGATDAYMFRNGKIGICIECGYLKQASENVDLAFSSILVFLQYFGLITEKQSGFNRSQAYMSVEKIVKKQSDNFHFEKEYSDFDSLEKGELFAKDGQQEYVAEEGQYILFPRSNKSVGEEVFTLAKKINF